MLKIQIGAYLMVGTWKKIKLVSLQNEVSASNLIDALAEEWLSGYEMQEPWALKVLGGALEREQKSKTRSKRAPRPEFAQIPPQTLQNG